ncbi:MAG TPA: acetylglutamate kinase, partial [Fibrobacteraceae bacterium]|nr:acetylglutamate kinase [Fibrobacteraceae bacterium]
MKKVVIKIGGSLAVDEEKLSDFVTAVSSFSNKDYRLCVVHGG